jgi:thiol-disulfide isomerase/thioredoxin
VTLATESMAPPALRPASPRYRGLRGAVAYAFFVAAIMIPVAILVALLIGYLTERRDVGVHVARRILLLGAIAGAAGGMGRYICGATWERLSLYRTVRGDWGALAGFLAAMLLVGQGGQAASSQDANQKLRIGGPVEIEGPTMDGKRFNLAEHRGKVVLVDFWATWCGPCLAELPNIKKVYEEYHGQGLEIVGVSLDYDRATLAKFTKAKRMPWPQVVFDRDDALGWNNPMAQKYGIDAIPCMLIVDPDGNLVEYGVRGAEMETVVASLLGTHVSSSAHAVSLIGRLLSWLMYAVLQAPVKPLVLACLGGALAGAVAEACIHRARILSKRGSLPVPPVRRP